MKLRWPLLVLGLLFALPQAAASHATDTLPALAGDEPVDRTVDWLADTQLGEQGCVDKEGCNNRWTKWVTVAVTHAGVDPHAWPTADASIAGWLLDHSDDLRDAKLRDCQHDENRSAEDCADLRVYSHAKSILALRAAGEDPRRIPLPDGGQRDLVAELLDEHGGTEFGKQTLANDDIWALVALNSAGYGGTEVDDALQRIENAQNPDGSLSPGANGFPSVDVTASAIMAVAPHDRETFLDNARSYLEDQQVGDGDRAACWRMSDFGDEPNAQSTAWALLAVTALGDDPQTWTVDGQHPVECLRTFRTDDGGFRHSDGSSSSIWPTHQALAALSWQPYGAVDGPTTRLTVTDQATVGEPHTATVPDALLRLGMDATEEHTWTPDEAGQRVFHGVTEDTLRPLQLVVDVQETSSKGSTGSSSSSGSTGSSEGGPSSESSEKPSPSADLAVPAEAERNVTFTVNVTGDPADAPVTGFRLQTPGDARSDWQPAGTFDVTITQLGEQTIQAWARDADGHVSEAAEATVTVVDAAPRLTLEGPTVVNRSTPATFHADARDPDGSAPNVTWTGPDGEQRRGPRAAFAFADPGEHRIHARAHDQANGTTQASWTVHARNRPPTNLTVEPGELAANTTDVLHADARDPDGDPLEIAWRTPDEPQPSSWGAQRHVETGPPGEIELRVNVSDPHGGWTHARLTLPVREQPNDDPASPITNVTMAASEPAPPPARPSPAEPATVDLPAEITVPANASRLLHLEADSPVGDVVNVTVALGGPLPVRGTENATAILPELPPGRYELTARAADRAGWGPWTNATLVVEPHDEPLQPASAEPTNDTPIGPIVALTALALAGRKPR